MGSTSRIQAGNHYSHLTPFQLSGSVLMGADVNDKVYKTAPSLCLRRQKEFQWQGRTWLALRQERHLPNCDKLGGIAESRWHVFSRRLTASNSYLRHKLPCNAARHRPPCTSTPSIPHFYLLTSQLYLLCPVRFNQTVFLAHFKNLTNSNSGYRIRD